MSDRSSRGYLKGFLGSNQGSHRVTRGDYSRVIYIMPDREKRLLVTKYSVPVVFIHALQTLHWTSKDRHRLLINRTRKKSYAYCLKARWISLWALNGVKLNGGIQSLSLAFHWVKTKINSKRTLNLWDLCHETRTHVALRDITTKLLHLHVPGLAIDPTPFPSFKSPDRKL